MYQTIGSLSGPLASFVPASDVPNTARIVISADRLSALSAGDQAELKSVFDAGGVIVCLTDNPDQARNLIAAVAPRSPLILPDATAIDALAIRRTVRGYVITSFVASTAHAPVVTRDVKTDQPTGAPAAASAPPATSVRAAEDVGRVSVVSHPQFRATRLLNWLGTASGVPLPKIEIESAPRAVADAAGGDGPLNLWDQAQQISSEKLYTLDADGTTFTVQIVTLAMAVTVTTQSNPNPSDFILLAQYYQLNPSPCYVNHDDRHKGYYARYYKTNTYPSDSKSNGSQVKLLQNSPSGSSGATSVTSGVNYTFGGSVGFFGKDGTANVNADVSITQSQTIQVPDVLVRNLSLDNVNNGRWSFEMPQVEPTDAFKTSLSDPVNLSTSNFSPMTYMLFEAYQRVRPSNIYFTTELELQLEDVNEFYYFVAYELEITHLTWKPTFSTSVSFYQDPN